MNIFNDDCADVQKEAKTDSEGSIFLSKSLTDDKDFVMCALAQKPISYMEEDPFDKKNTPPRKRKRYAANFAVFDEKGENFVGMKLWETGPKHMDAILDARVEQGTMKLYKLIRNGIKGDSGTTYGFYAKRDLTDAEMEMLANQDLLEIRAGGQNGEYLEDFKNTLSVEVRRIKWSKDDWDVAVLTFWGDDRGVESLDPMERDELVAGLRSVVEGADPKTFERTIDLPEDNFF